MSTAIEEANRNIDKILEAAKWIPPDHYRAAKQGWGIFAADGGHNDGKLRIQRYDDPVQASADIFGVDDNDELRIVIPLLKSDYHALQKVRRRAQAGDPTARKALKIHDQRYMP